MENTQEEITPPTTPAPLLPPLRRYKRFTPEQWAEVKERLIAGAPARVLSAEYGMAVSTIHKRASAEKWREVDGRAGRTIPRRNSISPKMHAQVRELYSVKKLTAPYITQLTGVSVSYIRKRASIEGWTKQKTAAPPVELPPDPPPPEPPPPWDEIAHDAQRAPQGAWRTWLFQGGRGAGKTRAGAEWFDAMARATPHGVFALVGATYHDVREVMIEGESGIVNLGRGEPPQYEVSRRRLVYREGAVAFAFSAEESRRLRGPQFHGAWADEFCAWPKPADTLSNLRLALRRGPNPRLVITTTPKAIPELRRLHDEKGCIVTRAGSIANADNLSPAFIEHLRDVYGETNLARQELDGVMLEDAPGVMWTHKTLRDCRGATPESFERVVVAVDPPAGTGGSACGIVVAARREGRGYVLADYSVRDHSPLGWARRVCAAARDFNADAIVAEANQGGDMVRATLAGAGPVCGIELVRAHTSKRFRAAPVSMLYERGRITHCGDFVELEEEMMAMSRDPLKRDSTGDRADALVWALSHLLVDVLPVPLWRVRGV